MEGFSSSTEIADADFRCLATQVCIGENNVDEGLHRPQSGKPAAARAAGVKLGIPSSLFGLKVTLQRRLILAAALCVSLALAAASVSIGFVLHRFVRGQLDGRLNARIMALVPKLRSGPDRSIAVRGDREVPPFDRPRSGWYWQVSRSDTVLGSPSLDGARLDVPDPGTRLREAGRPIPADGAGPFGEGLILRLLTAQSKPGEIPTGIAASTAALYGPVLEALRTLALYLVVIGLLLLAGVLLQDRLGLRPLRRLSEQLAEVRAGGRKRLPVDQPIEVRPLVGEINGLLAQNAANLEHARGHVANLAHGLKTPLAPREMAFGVSGSGRDARLAGLVEGMDRRIRHHMARAGGVHRRHGAREG